MEAVELEPDTATATLVLLEVTGNVFLSMVKKTRPTGLTFSGFECVCVYRVLKAQRLTRISMRRPLLIENA